MRVEPVLLHQALQDRAVVVAAAFSSGDDVQQVRLRPENLGEHGEHAVMPLALVEGADGQKDRAVGPQAEVTARLGLVERPEEIAIHAVRHDADLLRGRAQADRNILQRSAAAVSSRGRAQADLGPVQTMVASRTILPRRVIITGRPSTTAERGGESVGCLVGIDGSELARLVQTSDEGRPTGSTRHRKAT